MYADLPSLTYVTGPNPSGPLPLCLLLNHNELNILPQFLAHYRSFGPMQFLAIDDHSTDGSRGFLAEQPDVTLYQPADGTAYNTHKRQWRSEPLDAFAAGRWCLVPDVDEHLIWQDFENRPFCDLLADLDAEGAQGIAATMVDMYADRPISDHISTKAPLATDFAYFDDPSKDTNAYRAILPGHRFRRRYPTPLMVAMGGMRDRMFRAGIARHSAMARWLLRGSIQRSRMPEGLAYLREAALYPLARAHGGLVPLNLTKLPLLRWPRGAQFNGGAHHLSERLHLSREKAVLLHYSMTRGAEGVRYITKRGQHASGGGYYDAIEPLLNANPLYDGSSKFTGSQSLRGFF